MKKLGKITANFFRAIWQDFVNGIKRHWMRYLGYAIIYIVPVALLIIQNISHKTDVAYLPVWLYPILALVIIIYFVRIRKRINIGLATEAVADRLGAVQNAGKRIGYEILDKAMLVATVGLFYAIVRVISEMGTKMEHAMLVVLISTSIGSLLCIFDTVYNIGLNFESNQE